MLVIVGDAGKNGRAPFLGRGGVGGGWARRLLVPALGVLGHVPVHVSGSALRLRPQRGLLRGAGERRAPGETRGGRADTPRRHRLQDVQHRLQQVRGRDAQLVLRLRVVRLLAQQDAQQALAQLPLLPLQPQRSLLLLLYAPQLSLLQPPPLLQLLLPQGLLLLLLLLDLQGLRERGTASEGPGARPHARGGSGLSDAPRPEVPDDGLADTAPIPATPGGHASIRARCTPHGKATWHSPGQAFRGWPRPLCGRHTRELR